MVSRLVQTGEVATDVMLLGFVDGGGGRLDLNEAKLIWAIVMSNGKVAAVGYEDGEYVDQKLGRQLLISKTIKDIRKVVPE